MASHDPPAPPQPVATPALAGRRRTLRAQLSVTLMLAVGLPLLAAGAAGASLLYRRERQAVEQSLTNIAVAVARQIEAHLHDHLDVVRELAGQVEVKGRLDDASLQQVLARIHVVHPEFRTLLVADAEGRIRVVEPTVDPQGRKVLATPRSVSDREYFQEPMRTGGPHVSGIFRGRGLGTDPIVAVSAPVVLAGRRAGVVEGSLDVSRIPLVQGLVAPAAFEVVILDGRDRVVWATPGAGYQPLQELAQTPLGRAHRAPGEGGGRYQGEGTEYLTASAAVQYADWHAIIRARADEVGRGAGRFLVTVAVTLAAGLLVALLLALLLARRATRPLEALGRSVRAFLSGATPEPQRVSRRAPREVAELVEGYEELQRRVGRTLSGLLPVCAWCRRIRDGEDHWQPLETYVQSRFAAKVTHGLCPDCERRLDPSAGEAAPEAGGPAGQGQGEGPG